MRVEMAYEVTTWCVKNLRLTHQPNQAASAERQEAGTMH